MTTTFQDTCNPTHESTNNAQTSQSFPWTCRLLQKIYQGICQNSKTTHLTHQTASEIQMDT